MDHAGKRVYFCCKGCTGAFKKNPDAFVKKLESKGVVFEKAVKPVKATKTPKTPTTQKTQASKKGCSS